MVWIDVLFLCLSLYLDVVDSHLLLSWAGSGCCDTAPTLLITRAVPWQGTTRIFTSIPLFRLFDARSIGNRGRQTYAMRELRLRSRMEDARVRGVKAKLQAKGKPQAASGKHRHHRMKNSSTTGHSCTTTALRVPNFSAKPYFFCFVLYCFPQSSSSVLPTDRKPQNCGQPMDLTT